MKESLEIKNRRSGQWLSPDNSVRTAPFVEDNGSVIAGPKLDKELTRCCVSCIFQNVEVLSWRVFPSFSGVGWVDANAVQPLYVEERFREHS